MSSKLPLLASSLWSLDRKIELGAGGVDILHDIAADGARIVAVRALVGLLGPVDGEGRLAELEEIGQVAELDVVVLARIAAGAVVGGAAHGIGDVDARVVDGRDRAVIDVEAVALERRGDRTRDLHRGELARIVERRVARVAGARADGRGHRGRGAEAVEARRVVADAILAAQAVEIVELVLDARRQRVVGRVGESAAGEVLCWRSDSRPRWSLRRCSRWRPRCPRGPARRCCSTPCRPGRARPCRSVLLSTQASSLRSSTVTPEPGVLPLDLLSNWLTTFDGIRLDLELDIGAERDVIVHRPLGQEAEARRAGVVVDVVDEVRKPSSVSSMPRLAWP